MEFADSWLPAIFVAIGLILALTELLLGAGTAFDLLIIGSALTVSGLATWAVHSWIVTVVCGAIICILYVVFGRRYVQTWAQPRSSRTNVDALIGKIGVVEEAIHPDKAGLVRLGSEHWRASASESIQAEERVMVVSISGVTLSVRKVAKEDL